MSESTLQAPRATVFIAASETDSNLYYATKFVAPDPFIYLEIKGERILVMSDLEMDRAKSQASVDRVVSSRRPRRFVISRRPNGPRKRPSRQRTTRCAVRRSMATSCGSMGRR